MPPNVLHNWDLIASKRQLHVIPVRNEDIDNGNCQYSVLNEKLVIFPTIATEEITRTLWKEVLRNDSNVTVIGDSEETEASNSSKLLTSLSSIRILNDEERERNWLNLFGGRLSNVSPELLKGLREHAPESNNMSTVADFNDNLYYHMQQERGLRHFDGLNSSTIEELEDALQANEYLGSFLTTKSSLPQPAHVDYPWEVLDAHAEDQNLKIGFFPLTEEGMFLQVWPTADPSQDPSIAIEGQIIFIPHGKLLTIPASTIHGGGFRTTELRGSSNGGKRGNLRFHLYIATNQASLPAHQQNKYTEPCDRTKELSRRYVDSKHMKILLENFFV